MVSRLGYGNLSIIIIYKLAVLVIALYDHSCLCLMTCEAEPIMADP